LLLGLTKAIPVKIGYVSAVVMSEMPCRIHLSPRRLQAVDSIAAAGVGTARRSQHGAPC
jgi:hypothetical protein